VSSNQDRTGTPLPSTYPPYPPPSPTSVAGTNMCAVLSLVLAFVFAPAGLVLGIVALRQTRRTGEGGRGLAWAGLVISVLSVLFVVLVFALMFSVRVS